MLHVLSNFDHPDWNLKYSRETIDFADVIDRCCVKFESAEMTAEAGSNDLFARTAGRLRQIQTYLADRKFYETTNSTIHNELPTVPDPNTFPSFMSLDEQWLREIMEPWCVFNSSIPPCLKSQFMRNEAVHLQD